MDIKCKLSIKALNIEQNSAAVNPDNSIPSKNIGGPKISYSGKKDYIEYEFSNFESINTLRNTLDDLLTHLDMAAKIRTEIEKKEEQLESDKIKQ